MDGEPVKVQGKEHADTEAKTLGATLKAPDDGGALAPQADIATLAPVDPAVLAQSDSAKDAEIAALKAQLAQITTKTVQVTEGATPEPMSRVPAGVPRKYDGILDDKAKADLKRRGVEITRIVLEESETIPPTGLFLGHNGRGYNIVPGTEVDVPNFLLGVLDDAVMSAPVVDSKTQKVLGYRSRRKYNYRLV